jgi:hypothetical protein
MAITAARLATGRAEVLVFDGAYHGGVLSFSGRDKPWNVPFPYRYGRYNDVEATAAALAHDPDAVAAVLVELMIGSAGAIPADPEFLVYLRETTARHGIVLILDEVMTSRHGPGGLQGRLGLIPTALTADLLVRMEPAAAYPVRSPVRLARGEVDDGGDHAAGAGCGGTAGCRRALPGCEGDAADAGCGVGDGGRLARGGGAVRRHGPADLVRLGPSLQ